MADDGEKLDEERACNSRAAARAVIDDRSFVMMIPNDDDASIFVMIYISIDVAEVGDDERGTSSSFFRDSHLFSHRLDRGQPAAGKEDADIAGD